MVAAFDPRVAAAGDESALRSEGRDDIVRIVEYARFPRALPHQRLRLGFTRDVSASGLCLGVDRPEPVDSLIRLLVHDVDGRSDTPCIGRVVWSKSERDGRYWLGIELLAPDTRGAIRCRRAADATLLRNPESRRAL